MKPISKIIFGAPGSGKGTLAKFARRAGFVHVESGELLRQSNLQADRVHQGKLASDDVVLDLIGAKMCEAGFDSNFVFDGVPRSIPQARALINFLTKEGHEIVTVHVTIDESVARRRIRNRLKEQGRNDDTPKIVDERMAQFEDYGGLVLTHLRRFTKVVEIDNNGSQERALAQFASLLETLRGSSHYSFV